MFFSWWIMIKLGYVIRAFGIKGGVSIKLYSLDSESIQEGTELILRQGTKDQKLRVQEVLQGNRLIFEGISDRNQAEALRGAEILIEREKLPTLREDEFYLSDMLGASVLLSNGEKAGTVVDFSSNGPQVLLEIKTIAGYIASIPLVPAIVKKIDSENKIIIIDPPEGLLEP